LQSHQSGQVGMDRGYVDKKTIFLSNEGQVPSKDNHSVISYTSYNNGARFSSTSNRKDRDDFEKGRIWDNEEIKIVLQCNDRSFEIKHFPIV
jgi:hypothetical protein